MIYLDNMIKLILENARDNITKCLEGSFTHDQANLITIIESIIDDWTASIENTKKPEIRLIKPLKNEKE